MLLSPVRSNEQGKLGFTAVDNRVCVALSRARLGFYCACNLSMLGDGSELWNKVRKYLTPTLTPCPNPNPTLALTLTLPLPQPLP